MMRIGIAVVVVSMLGTNAFGQLEGFFASETAYVNGSTRILYDDGDAIQGNYQMQLVSHHTNTLAFAFTLWVDDWAS